jgi:hypothetical protein
MNRVLKGWRQHRPALAKVVQRMQQPGHCREEAEGGIGGTCADLQPPADRRPGEPGKD